MRVAGELRCVQILTRVGNDSSGGANFRTRAPRPLVVHIAVIGVQVHVLPVLSVDTIQPVSANKAVDDRIRELAVLAVACPRA